MKLDFTQIKAVFIDLDGTLLDDKHQQISPTNLEAIKQLQAKTNVIISTGRLGQNLNQYLKLTNVKYAVAGNGSQIIDVQTNQILLSHTLDAQTQELIVNYALQHKLAFKINDEKSVYNVKGIWSKIICKFLGYKISKQSNLTTREIFKIVLWGKSKHKIHKIIQDLTKKLFNVSIVSSYQGYIIEITNINATKGLGNQYVWKNLLNITNINQTIHIGDSMNDSTTIGFIGSLIVMKNSPRCLIELADYLGPHYKQGGLAKIIQGYDLKPIAKFAK